MWLETLGIGVRVMLPDWVERLPIAFNRRFDDACDGIRATIGNAIAARRPEIEARVLTELDEVLGDRPVVSDDVSRLPYLSYIIREALRLHHPGWIITRRTITETRLSAWTLPAGTELAYSQHALHRDPAFYPDPLTFNPERWSDDTQTLPPGAFVPFGADRHRCMGEHLAMTEMITALATLLRRWRLELAPGQTIKMVARATVWPRTLVMTVRPCKDAAARAAA